MMNVLGAICDSGKPVFCISREENPPTESKGEFLMIGLCSGLPAEYRAKIPHACASPSSPFALSVGKWIFNE